MCGRFSLFVPPDVLESRFDAETAEPLSPRYNVAPGDEIATIRNDAPGEIDRLEWGLLPGWVDDPDDYPRPINARAETIAEKPSFREALSDRRCLVLADGFYEWEGANGRKQPHRITRNDGAPFAFAGLWETWRSDDDTRRTVTIVTTDANATVAPIHDRMPVVLPADQEHRWLETDDPEVLGETLGPYPGDDLVAYPVSRSVDDPANDSPAVVEPADAGDQSDLSDFG